VCYFNLGARLARFTGNTIFSGLATGAYDWLVSVGFLAVDDNYAIYDGAHVEFNCTDIDKAQFSYSGSAATLGAAFMYNLVSFPPNPPLPKCSPSVTLSPDIRLPTLEAKTRRTHHLDPLLFLPREHRLRNRLRVDLFMHDRHARL